MAGYGTPMPDESADKNTRPFPGDRTKDQTPHSSLNNPVGEPDPTEWPDPYESRPDPREPARDMLDDERHPPTGATTTSEPHPSDDPEAEYWEGPKRDKVDD
jgi:hypothetical protein